MNTLTPEQLDIKLEKADFEMFSKSGNNACRREVKKIFKAIRGKKRLTEDDVVTLMDNAFKKIKEKHPEVYDTEPRYHIRKFLEYCCREVQYDFDIFW